MNREIIILFWHYYFDYSLFPVLFRNSFLGDIMGNTIRI